MTDTETAPAEEPRLLREIAEEIFTAWETMRVKGENHPAWGYADAMRSLDTLNDRYFADGARDIVQRFLAEARVWRGTTARRIKAELKAMLDA
jgi:hypothetical protein